jgi:hypothetical protein
MNTSARTVSDTSPIVRAYCLLCHRDLDGLKV